MRRSQYFLSWHIHAFLVWLSGMELRHLRYFVAVAEELNLTRAAARLRLAQPALSRQMQDLEAELETKLFIRARIGVRLSQAGKAFYPRAKSILAQAVAAIDAARTAEGIMSGKLVIGFPSGLHLDHMRPMMKSFRKDHPGVILDYHHALPGQQLKALKEGKLDIAYVNLPLAGDQFESHVIMTVPFQVVMPRNHPLARRRELELADLKGQDIVFCTRESRPEFYDEFFRLCFNAGFRPSVLKEIGGYPTNILALVALEVGISIVPRFRGVEEIGGLVWRPLAKPKLSVQFALVWRKAEISLVLQEFISTVRKQFPLDAEPHPELVVD